MADSFQVLVMREAQLAYAGGTEAVTLIHCSVEGATVRTPTGFPGMPVTLLIVLPNQSLLICPSTVTGIRTMHGQPVADIAFDPMPIATESRLGRWLRDQERHPSPSLV
jgi:hypothetical protein